jgi:ABC-2 type transport system permease protein
MFRWHVVSAVFWRNLKQYFTGVIGYLFIVAFVTVCAILAFAPQFFADNLANLDQLSRYYPELLLLFIPAITMPLWAEEKRSGTDSILFTLPASDFDVLLGKYLAAVAVYTIALLFSGTILFEIGFLGSPDWGIIGTTYLGYWLSGASLIAIGMFASSLTGSTTVAFILGALFCAIPVLGQYLGDRLGFDRFSLGWHLEGFTNGQVSLASIIYFVGLAVVMLYLNMVVISRRHWNRGKAGNIGWQLVVRAICLAVAAFSIFHIVDTSPATARAQLDLTQEKVFTLNPATMEALKKVSDSDKKITVEAFISEDIPQKYTNVKRNLEAMLRQYDSFGGSNVDVNVNHVTPNSDLEVAAQKLGIEAREDRSEEDGITVQRDVYLGAHVSSAAGETTLPFFDSNNSIEYELSHAIYTTIDKGNKLTLGILETDAQFGGPLYQGRRIPWSYSNTLDVLKQQFKIKYIRGDELDTFLPEEEAEGESKPEGGDAEGENGEAEEEAKPAKKVREAPDVLLVADPASMDAPSMESLVKYLEAGNPAIILADPLPFFWAYQNPRYLGVLNAPKMSRVNQQQSPYAEILSTSQLPKADGGSASTLFSALGVQWDNGSAVWNMEDPHPGFDAQWPPGLGQNWPAYYGPFNKAFVYVKENDSGSAFNVEDPISAGLQELLMFYPGSIMQGSGSKYEFTPLASIGVASGRTAWDELTTTPTQKMQMLNPRTGELTVREEPARSQITMADLVVLNPTPRTMIDSQDHCVAARVHAKGDAEGGLNVVIIADLDFVTDLAWQQEEALDEQIGQKLDNVGFLLNAIEVLGGADAFVELRNRRQRPRTLVQLESIFKGFRQKRMDKQQEIEDRVEAQLDEAQEKLDVATAEIQGNESLGFLEKLQKTSQRATDVQKQFDIKQKRLSKELKEEVTALKNEEKKEIDRCKNWIRIRTALIAPLLPLMLGVAVLWFRVFNEQKNINPNRRVK